MQESGTKLEKSENNTVKNELSIRNRVLNWVTPVVLAIICLFLLYQHFIKKRIRRSIKQGTEKSSLLFRVDELKNPTGFVDKLRHSQDPLSKHLRGRFSQTTQQLLNKYDGSNFQFELLQKALVDELNQLLKGGRLFEKQRFTQIQLTEETQMRIKQNPQGEDLIRLNRLLLEEAYPDEIATSSAKLVRDEQYPNQEVLLQRQSTLKQEVSQIQQQLNRLQSEFDTFRSQYGEIPGRLTKLERTVEGTKVEKTTEGAEVGDINQILLTLNMGIITLNSTVQEMRVFVSEASKIKPSLDKLNENLPQIPTQASMGPVINSEVIAKLETTMSKVEEAIGTFVPDWKNSISEIKQSLDGLSAHIREAITQKTGTAGGETWDPFINFIKSDLELGEISSLEKAINSVSRAGGNPVEKRSCFEEVAKAIKLVYEKSLIEPEKVNFEYFVNQFKEQQFQEKLKLQIYGWDAEGKQLHNLPYRPSVVSFNELKPNTPQRAIYDKKLSNKQSKGKAQSGQIIAVLSPGIKSTHQPDWNIPPEVAVYGE
jgi:archaellum component FlaC